MKMVMGEALSVHDMSLFDAINETDIDDIWIFWPIFVSALFMALSCVFAYGIHWLRNVIEEIKRKDENATFF
uniref:Uncharacterized protein n=1 Tax=Caenorhabditis japonica TaxID=281687 RepID=A0A8R1HUB1_CAEJA